MKLALFTDTYPPSVDGVSHFTEKLADELSRNHDVAVFAMGDKNEIKKGAFSIHTFKGANLKMYPQYRYKIVPPYLKVLKELKKFRPDVIHAQTPFTMGAVGEYSARKLKVPLVSTFHTDLIGFISEIIKGGNVNTSRVAKMIVKTQFGKRASMKCVNMFSRPAFYSYFESSDAVTGPSDEVNRLLISRGVDKNKVFKIRNFIETNPKGISGKEFREKWGIEGPMVLHVGRLSWEKRIDKILEVAENRKDITFVITSDGPTRDELLGIKQKKQLDNVIFTGFLPYNELYGGYAASDAFIAMSPFETFNMSAAQALAFGKPIIGVNNMGLKEFIRPNENGFLVNINENELAAHCKCLDALFSDERLRKRMGRKSKRMAGEFSTDKIVKQYEELYKSVKVNGTKMRKYIYAMSLLFTFVRALRI